MRSGNLGAAKTISLDSYILEYSKNNITMSQCQQMQLLKQGRDKKINFSKLHKLQNYLQVTIENINLIFDLNEDNPIVLKELDDTEQLMNPHTFIETGFKLVTMMPS